MSDQPWESDLLFSASEVSELLKSMSLCRLISVASRLSWNREWDASFQIFAFQRRVISRSVGGIQAFDVGKINHCQEPKFYIWQFPCGQWVYKLLQILPQMSNKKVLLELERPVSLDEMQTVVKIGGTLRKAVKQINDFCRGTEHKGDEILTCWESVCLRDYMCDQQSWCFYMII